MHLHPVYMGPVDCWRERSPRRTSVAKAYFGACQYLFAVRERRCMIVAQAILATRAHLRKRC